MQFSFTILLAAAAAGVVVAAPGQGYYDQQHYLRARTTTNTETITRTPPANRYGPTTVPVPDYVTAITITAPVPRAATASLAADGPGGIIADTPAPAACKQPSAVANGGFETGLSPWTSSDSANATISVSTSAAVARTGAGYISVRASRAPASATISQTISVCRGTEYTFSFWVQKSGAVAASGCTAVLSLDGMAFAVVIPGVQTGWVRSIAVGTYIPTTDEAVLAVTVSCMDAADSAELLVDDVTLSLA
ncbi:hypothetical protein BZA05DRAFT_384979 [Tricharina praecox]|uniref:uncharacterized protein n=1 Tax=Tricharina praecox TaxID=43433 RepID=UPI00221FB061|nr:uncharacterized protein BZA05DRAFT_384979 [Tricharina praecox]KAI5857836.1 hypothetical protein BZA05DRAFT_384979 [Tricharina praecox]